MYIVKHYKRVARLEVQVPELSKVGAHDLVGVHKDDLAQVEREQHVQEQDLVRPDQPLLLRLPNILLLFFFAYR